MAIDRTLLNFDASANYQKIWLENDVNMSVADPSSSTSAVVTHNLGYKPRVRVWWTNGSGKWCTAVSTAISNMYPLTSDFDNRSVYYKVSNSTLTIYFDRGVTSGTTRTTTVHYRIYYDGI